MSAPISVLVLTLNEEKNLEACLQTFTWTDDVIVLDSGSTDRTRQIAEAAGARVFTRQFDDWSSHQNWAVRNLPFRNGWVYYTDADERMTPELQCELTAIATAGSTSCVAYRVRFKNMFLGRWIRRASMYPVWVLRFFRPDKVGWERLVNPVAVVEGTEGKLMGHFEHYSFNNGFNAWFEKHNNYSSGEARELLRGLTARITWRALFGADAASRRKALKAVAYRVPFRPFLVLFYLYFVRGGWLEGMAGFRYCLLRFIYEYMIDMKVLEARRAGEGMSL